MFSFMFTDTREWKLSVVRIVVMMVFTVNAGLSIRHLIMQHFLDVSFRISFYSYGMLQLISIHVTNMM